MSFQSQQDRVIGVTWRTAIARLEFALLPLLFVAAHGALLVVSGSHAWLVSLIFLTLVPLMAAAACLYRARRSAYARGWAALSLALLLWTVGMAGNLYSGLVLDSWSGV